MLQRRGFLSTPTKKHPLQKKPPPQTKNTAKEVDFSPQPVINHSLLAPTANGNIIDHFHLFLSFWKWLAVVVSYLADMLIVAPVTVFEFVEYKTTKMHFFA